MNLATLALLTVAFAPLASADHFDANGADARFYAGYTLEDDDAVVNYPAHPLDGIANKVKLLPTNTPGDGGLFLDHYIGETRVNNEPYAAFYGDVAGDRIPPYGAHRARYGWWLDKDLDGRIDDNHDSSCATAPGTDACATDEFQWRGDASGEKTPLVGWAIPSNTWWGTAAETRFGPFCWEGPTNDVIEWTIGGDYTPGDYAHTLYNCHAPAFAAYHDGANGNTQGAFSDQTEPTVYDHQVYRGGNGFENPYTDDGFLVTTYFVVAANAARDAGVAGGYDIHAPGVLIDVDRFESVDPTVESMYVAAMHDARARYHAAVDAVWNPAEAAFTDGLSVFDPFVAIIDDAVTPIVEPFLISAEDAINNGFDLGANPTFLTAHKALYSPLTKEPNSAHDVYPYATFGGVGDKMGTGNDYSAYAGSWLLYGDAYARMGIGMIANVNLGPNGGQGVQGELADVTPILSEELFNTEVGWTYLDPFGAGDASDSRSAVPKMTFVGSAVAWNDISGDGWVGTMCDPDSPDPCDPFNGGAYSTPHGGGGGETTGLCAETSLPGGTISVTPVGGDWPGVIVLRYYDRPTKNVWEDPQGTYRTELVIGSDPILIRWDPGWNFCKAGGASTRSLDEIYFPRGLGGITLRTETTVRLVNPYTSADAVTHAAGESFTDVDYYVTGL